VTWLTPSPDPQLRTGGVDATAGAAADNAMALHASAAVVNIVAWTILATRMSFLAV